MSTSIFITGIGTDVGKTLVAAIVTEALNADYWKPVQAGYADGTDTQQVKELLSNNTSVVHTELYRLATPASPHIAASKEGVTINAEQISEQAKQIMDNNQQRPLVIEGAGGLLVPLTPELMVADLAAKLKARVIIVSRNYLGSINHSLLTAAYCSNIGLQVAGWIFSDDYLSYENEIVQWSGYPSIGSVPRLNTINKQVIHEQAMRLRGSLSAHLNLPL